MKKRYGFLALCLSLAFVLFSFTKGAAGNDTDRVGKLNSSTSALSSSKEQVVAQANSLSGRWRGNDGGIYYIRQVGDEIFWFGESGDQIPWTNVYHGYTSGNRIIGSWADVPKGNVRQAGEMDLSVRSSRRIISQRKTGGGWVVANGLVNENQKVQ